MPVTTVSIPNFSPSVCSMSGTSWLTPSPPDMAAFNARSANGVKFIKNTELFNVKIALSVFSISLMWHLLPSVAALLTFKALPWIPTMQKGRHFPTAWGSESGWAKGWNLWQAGSYGENQLPALLRVGRGSWLFCPLQMTIVQTEKQSKLFISCIKATAPGWQLCFLPSIPCNTRSFRTKNKKSHWKSNREFSMVEKGKETIQADSNPWFIKRIGEAAVLL